MKKELMKVLKDSGIRDAIGKLRDYEYRDYCLFNADVAESVLPIFEAESDSKAPRLSIEGIRKWYKGEISDEELKALSDSAYAAAYSADAAFDAAYAAAYASDAAADAAAAADADAADTVDTAYAAASAAAYAAAGDDAAYAKKWEEIEQIFIKHFGDES
jgi:hypothetical protein